MHGLLNRSIQSFVCETYGHSAWQSIASAADIDDRGFEAMLQYDDAITLGLLQAIAQHLNKPVEMVLEDIGTFVVSHGSFERLRRLLRFGGESFVDFLYSLDELQGRVHLALPDLNAPKLEICEQGDGAFTLKCSWAFPEACHVLMGVLRAMADDYGALVLLDYSDSDEASHGTVRIDLLDSRFAAGRDFNLTMVEG